MVALEEVTEEDEKVIHELVRNHHEYTKSPKAKDVLDNFKFHMRRFVKVMPLEYKRVMDEEKLEKKLGLTEVSDG